MNKNAISVAILCVVLSGYRSSTAQRVFFREHWAEFDAEISNSRGRMLRVNDAKLSLHEVYGKRQDDLFGLPRCGLASQSRRKTP